MKYSLVSGVMEDAESLPVRGAWVEIGVSDRMIAASSGRSPCGERGLKYQQRGNHRLPEWVAPRAGSVG